MVLNHQKFDFGDKCLIEKVVLQAPFRFSINFHDEACFIYFLEGETKINSPYEQVRIEPEESVLLKCGSYFADLLKNSPAGKYEVPSFVKHSENKSFIHKVGAHDLVKKFIESLYFYLDNPGLVSDELLELKVRELVLLLIQTKNAATIVSLFTDLFSPRHINIKELVNNHLFSDLSIEGLANLANLSVSTFNRTFQALFNDTPANYIKMKRLERAKDLLAMSSLTVNEIAFQTGFKDVAHFSRSFKAAHLCSPSAYRLSMKKT